MTRIFVGTGLLVVGLTVHVAGAERPWVEARSPHFTVASDDGDKTARRILWEFEQVADALGKILPWKQGPLDKPILVLVARDEVSMRGLAPQYWEVKNGVRPDAVFATGLDRHYILLRKTTVGGGNVGINPYQSAYWSYTSLALRSSLKIDLPLWLSRGMASVLSNTIVGEKNIDIGPVIPWHLRRLQSGEQLLLPEMLTIDRDSRWYKDAQRLATFDAQSWAFVHYLMFGEQGRRLEPLARYISLLVESKPSAASFQLTLGDVDELQKGLAVYTSRQLFRILRMGTELTLTPEGFVARPLPPEESAALRAAAHVTLGRNGEARELLKEARSANANAPASWEAEGLLLESEGKRDEARTAYEKAIQLGSKHFYPYYAAAALTRPGQMTDELARIDTWLEKAGSLNDAFAPTLSMLADVKLAAGKTDEALKLATRAVTLEPGRAPFRLALARALWAGSRREEAKGQAREALKVSTNENEQLAAQRWLDTAETPPPAGSAPAAASQSTGTSNSRPTQPRAVRPDGTTLPRPLHEERPQYTKAALEARIQGSVRVDCVVLEDGSVGDVAVVNSLDRQFGLDDEAVKAARLWTWEPGTKDGRPVRVSVTLELTFTLK